MVIGNTMVYTQDYHFRMGSIVIHGDTIEDVIFEDNNMDNRKENKDRTYIDGQGCYAVPGMTDIHFHGCNGYDFCDGTIEAVDGIAKYQVMMGVTTVAPATMTLPVPELEHILSVAAQYKAIQQEQGYTDRADLIGINMEGPFISEEKKGAQDNRYIRACDVELYKKFQRAADGLVKIIGIAPEVHDPRSFIEKVKKEAVVSIAHSGADYDTAKGAIDAGVTHMTHLFNAMTGLHHRKPGIVCAAAENEAVTVELICDGLHIHPAMIRMCFQLFGRDRIILISDSMRATGLKNGIYTLGGQEVRVCGNRAFMVQDNVLAGSVTTLPGCVKYLVKEAGIPLESAICCASVNPIKKMGLYSRYGSIAKGKKANILLMDKEIDVVKVIKDGVIH